MSFLSRVSGGVYFTSKESDWNVKTIGQTDGQFSFPYP